MTAAPDPGMAAFLAAITAHLTITWEHRADHDAAYETAAGDVKTAIALVLAGTPPEAVAAAWLNHGGNTWGAPGGGAWTCGGCGTRQPGSVAPAPGGRCGECEALAHQNVIDSTGHASNACEGPGWCYSCGGHVDAGGIFHPAVAS